MNQQANTAQPLIAHLMELRSRLLRMLTAIGVIFLALLYFSRNIYAFVAKPLVDALPEGTSMIATDVAAPFLVPFKLTLYVSIFIAVPFILHQTWAFIAPGLYRNEKRIALYLLSRYVLLFYFIYVFFFFYFFSLLFLFIIFFT